MGRFVVRRVVQAIPTFFGITLLAFTVLRLAPGDPVLIMSGHRICAPTSWRDTGGVRPRSAVAASSI